MGLTDVAYIRCKCVLICSSSFPIEELCLILYSKKKKEKKGTIVCYAPVLLSVQENYGPGFFSLFQKFFRKGWLCQEQSQEKVPFLKQTPSILFSGICMKENNLSVEINHREDSTEHNHIVHMTLFDRFTKIKHMPIR